MPVRSGLGEWEELRQHKGGSPRRAWSAGGGKGKGGSNYVSSFFGLAPLHFESNENGFTVTVSNAMCIYSFTLVSILMISTVCGLVAEINVGVERSVRMSSRMSQVVSACDVLVVVASAAVGVYGAPARMRSMLKFIDKVSAVDNSISAQYSAVTERKLCALLAAILIFFTVLLVDDFCFYVLQAKKIERHCNYYNQSQTLV
ncbi:hypothetical protein evm_008026 [Chilo suppressalis]|nr:hypothetical protein evm_008026 [Chilo suppressalis]